jgi:hypothetical protein
MTPPATQARVQQEAAAFDVMGKMIRSADVDVTLDAEGLHLDSIVEHR